MNNSVVQDVSFKYSNKTNNSSNSCNMKKKRQELSSNKNSSLGGN